MNESLQHALDRVAGAGHLLVALDFDGTLAPFTEDPEESRPHPRAQQALDALADLPRTSVAVISGRPLEFLRRVVDPGGHMLLSGSHGAETDLSAAGPAHRPAQEMTLSQEQRDVLSEAVAATRSAVARYPQSREELKPAGVAFHTRPMEDRELAARALEEVTRRYAGIPGLRLTPGQEVIECSVLSATKGDGLRAVQAAVPPETVTVFAGDDTTDEDALVALETGDVGIKVGEKETVAPWRVAGIEELAGTLAALARRRSELTTSMT